uniref:Albumin domain-containing protein n=1 Tax=Anolis carolinensis TaxID=28377 RepID=A0A803T9W0_ANOCA
MKWVTFISCLLLVSFAESKHLPRKYRDTVSQGDAEMPNRLINLVVQWSKDVHDTITRASELPPDDFAGIAMILYSQSAQQATYEEVHKLMDDIVALAKKCGADEHSDPECGKPLHTVFLDEICHEQEFANKHGFSDCCAKADAERNECFLAHKNATPGFIPPYQKPSADVACAKFAENKNEVLGHYIYEVSRRSPFAPVATVYKSTAAYEHVLTSCCAKEDKGACFQEEAPPVKKQLMEDLAIQKHVCAVMKKFGVETMQGLKMAQLSQKFPKASFETISKLTGDIVHIHEECCKGDTLESMLDREKLTKYVCSHQNEISSKLSACCEKPVVERGECIVHLENDDKPADLSETVREFVDNKEVCQHYADNKNQHLAKFLYQYGRRHPELSPQLLARSTRGYEELLDECCATEHPETCLPKGEGLLKKHISDTMELVKTRCDHYAQLGGYLYQNELLVAYTKKAPELSFKDLQKYTGQFRDVAAKCCKMDDAHRLTCAEGYADLAIGSICQSHEENHINKQICKCCSDNYFKRRPCFSELGVDPEFHPVAFDPALFTFHGDYCDAKEEEQQSMKQELLVNLIKHRPTISNEQLAVATVDFVTMVTKCCAVENHVECLTEELSKGRMLEINS